MPSDKKVERVVHLALSQKAARALQGTLEEFLQEYQDYDGIFEAIIVDIKEQIETKKRKNR